MTDNWSPMIRNGVGGGGQAEDGRVAVSDWKLVVVSNVGLVGEGGGGGKMVVTV